MGLLSKLAGKKEKPSGISISIKEDPGVTVDYSVNKYADSSSIDADERPYYQRDEYYTYYPHQGTAFEKRVITFDERKEISYPSRNGLYVAEILLLEYCSYGTYPKPKMGYPGFWWFEYGIRDIGHALKSLEERGYIKPEDGNSAIKRLTVAELKDIATKYNLPATGKKADLIETIISALSKDEIESIATNKKYVLTEKGSSELQENAYVPYMHKHARKTIESSQFGEQFNVWSINKLLQGKDVPRWREIVDEVEERLYGM